MTPVSIQPGQSQTRRSHGHQAAGVMLSANPRSLWRGFSFASVFGAWFSPYFYSFTGASSRGESEQ